MEFSNHLVLVGLAVVLLSILLSTVIFRSAQSRRPPIVPYALPWVGSALRMGKDPDAFLKDCMSKYGPMFSVKLLGQTLNFVTDPSLISTIYRDNQHFDFSRVRQQISIDVFDLPLDMFTSYTTETYYPAHHRALSPQNVQSMLRDYTEQAHKLFRKAIDAHSTYASTDLISFIIPPSYNSAAAAILGKGFPADRSYPPFRTFDDSFALMAAGLPRVFTRNARKAWDKLIDIVEEYLADVEGDNDLPKILEMTFNCAREAGWSRRSVAKTIAIDLWALEANAIWVAYWLIALALQQPAGLSPLYEEVDRVREEWLADHPGTPLTPDNFHDFVTESSKKLVLLTSAINETLRYVSSSSSIRRVVVPVELGGYHFDEGEQLLTATRMVHLDDDIHPDSKSFRMDRYVDYQMPSKDNKPVPNHSLPFGGGVSMCEGRHFALREMKALMTVLLTYADIETDVSSSQRPSLDWTRAGLGIMPPVGDMRVVVRKRKVA